MTTTTIHSVYCPICESKNYIKVQKVISCATGRVAHYIGKCATCYRIVTALPTPKPTDDDRNVQARLQKNWVNEGGVLGDLIQRFKTL